jgi:hypothetical protein
MPFLRELGLVLAVCSVVSFGKFAGKLLVLNVAWGLLALPVDFLTGVFQFFSPSAGNFLASFPNLTIVQEPQLFSPS